MNDGKAVTVLTYLHGVKEAQEVLDDIRAEGMDIDLIELRSLKPLDMDTIRSSLERTHKVRPQPARPIPHRLLTDSVALFGRWPSSTSRLSRAASARPSRR